MDNLSVNVATPQSPQALSLEQVLEHLAATFSTLIISAHIDRNHVVVQIDKAQVLPFFTELKNDKKLQINALMSVTGVDWMDSRDDRYEVVYHLLSMSTLARLRVKAALPEHKPEVSTLTSLWHSANFMEREAWDMLGIVFTGHPDLRRILMYDEFKGHPLRKDYPLQGKQPRVALRYPEVENTARQMVRSGLVAINKKKPSVEGV
jgi:NADH-quinone oxidoreductase subunit C